MVTTVVVLIAFLTLFIIYPLAILLVDSFISPDGGGFTLSVFKRIFDMWTFRTAIGNTLKVGFMVGIGSALIGLLFAYVEVYVKVRGKFMGGLFKVVSMLPVVSPPFVLSLSIIMLFGKSGIITRYLLHIYDNSVYGFWGIVIVQTMTFFPVCYLMLRGLLKNIDPSLEEAARDMGASRWKVFTSVTLPLMLPGLGNAFLVSFIESIADFANPMIIGGSYDTLATTIYLQITGAYDKIGAAAMAVVLLSITFIMFLVQKYYLERKTAATLTGKASRAACSSPIRAFGYRLPCCAAPLPFSSSSCISVCPSAPSLIHGAMISTSPSNGSERVFTRYHGLQAFTDSFCPVAHCGAHYLAALHDHQLPGGQKELQDQGLYRVCLHAGHGGARHRTGCRLYPRLCQWYLPYRLDAGVVWHRCHFGHRVHCAQPAHRYPQRYFRPTADR